MSDREKRIFRGEDVDLDSVLIDPACVVKIPAALALRKMVLPLCSIGGTFHVATGDTTDDTAIAAIERETSMAVETHSADPMQLREHLLRVYGDARGNSGMPAPGKTDDPVAIVDELLRTALLRHSSDIHFDPEATSVRVRFRTDGQLEEVMRIPSSLQASVVSRLKVMSEMDIAEKRAPQDGAFTWRASGAQRLPPLDVRCATLPVRHGERVTLRLLETEAERLELDSLGFSKKDAATFDDILSQPHGLVLLTGPTGSGKTTTLYAAIRRLLSLHEMNVLTVEDPVEYEIPGVSQAEVDSSDKVNFSKALKSLLRHDPDAIMIGEIRDGESLDTAVKAAMTGHLVFSTLHANDATTSVARLKDMGLEAHLVAATLRLSVAQRLVRSLCPECRIRRAATSAEALALGAGDGDGFSVWEKCGCLACAGRGFRGRTGIFEMFRPDRDIAALIASGAAENEIFDLAREKGMRTLREDACEKCFSGVTSAGEVLRTLGGVLRG
jgi:type IV pilus assembly protein PilB